MCASVVAFFPGSGANQTLFTAPKSDHSNVTGGTDYRPVLTMAWPVCENGWVLLGELDKYVPLSAVRFPFTNGLQPTPQTYCTAHGVKATVCGSAGEGEIELTALQPSSSSAPASVVVTKNNKNDVRRTESLKGTSPGTTASPSAGPACDESAGCCATAPVSGVLAGAGAERRSGVAAPSA